MKETKTLSVQFIAQAATIAAIYVVLTLVFAPFAYGEVQVRLSEALTILPVFTPAAVPGLFVGCLLSNILGGCIVPDFIFGSLATDRSHIYLPVAQSEPIPGAGSADPGQCPDRTFYPEIRVSGASAGPPGIRVSVRDIPTKKDRSLLCYLSFLLIISVMPLEVFL